jgi:predicted RNase H-like HicB family nuclease
MKYRVLIEQDEDGVYVAEVPSLPGCISQGATRGQALENIKEALAVYLESLEAHNEPVPPPKPFSKEMNSNSESVVWIAPFKSFSLPRPLP